LNQISRTFGGQKNSSVLRIIRSWNAFWDFFPYCLIILQPPKIIISLPNTQAVCPYLASAKVSSSIEY